MSAQKSRIAAIAVLAIVMKRKKQRSLESVKKRKCWVREWIWKRNEKGVHANLLKELENEDEASYFNFFRMSVNDFNFLLGKVKHFITKNDTVMRPAIPPNERLALTLRFLTTGMYIK